MKKNTLLFASFILLISGTILSQDIFSQVFAEESVTAVPTLMAVPTLYKEETEEVVERVSNTVTVKTTEKEKINNEITIYNGNVALVKQTRELDLEKGINEIQYTNVPKQIRANTVFFEDLSNPNSRILEQSYEYDLVSGTKMYEKYIDQTITVTIQKGDKTEEITGVLLSASGNIILKTEKGIQQFQRVSVISTDFPELPEGFLTKPTLVWSLWTDEAGKRETKTSFLTGGLSWASDYIAVVGENDDEISLQGWTTINNRSGASFEDAKLKLIAGDVNQVTPQAAPNYRMMKGMVMESAMDDSYSSGGGFKEEGFFEYHMYSLERATDIKDNATKQIELFSALGISSEKEFVFDSSKNSEKVRVELSFENKEENNLGMPIPKGILRVYKKDSEGSLQFIGEDSVKHTPKDEEIDIFMGNAFDITVKRREMGHKTTKNWVGFRECSFTDYEVSLKNHKEEAVVVNVYETVYGGNPEITYAEVSFYEDVNHEEDSKADDVKEVSFKNDGDKKFKVEIPVEKDGESVLNYTIQSCW